MLLSQSHPTHPVVVTPRRAAELLDVGIATVWRHIKSGKLKSFKLCAPGQKWGQRVVTFTHPPNT